MAFEKIIVLDDEMIIRKSLEAHLRNKRYSVASASNIADAEALLSKDEFDLMFVDVRLPDGKGTDLLERFSREPSAPMVVMITGYGTIESAVECMRLGAFDYVLKPFSHEHIDVLLKKAEEFKQLMEVNRYFLGDTEDEYALVGESPPMKKLRRMLRKIAATEATVLITGENGTGKELVAQALYHESLLSNQPYIRVNCAAIAEHLIESEFFGHEKGAFTGATERREGRFELAHNGTILLDEISEIPLRLQAKLLRVLQEQEFQRVGGNKTIKVKVRVLATTNRNLVEAVRKGDFREDLYYRLNVLPIDVMPLRERKEDIPLLAETFLKRFARKHGLEIPGFSESAMLALEGHEWPGNVRELQNCIERAVILSENGVPLQESVLGIATARVLIPAAESADEHAEGSSSGVQTMPPGVGELLPMHELEREQILRVLMQNNGNRTQTAEMLGVSIRTLRNKLNQYRDEGEIIP